MELLHVRDVTDAETLDSYLPQLPKYQNFKSISFQIKETLLQWKAIYCYQLINQQMEKYDCLNFLHRSYQKFCV